MRVISYFILFAFFLQVSCTKTLPPSSLASNKMIGTWKISNQVSGAWPYPQPESWPAYNYALAYQESLQFSLFSNDTFNVKFGADGIYNYTRPTGGYSFPAPGIILFTPFKLIQDSGPYRVLNDSEMLIVPDTSELLKFCFTSASSLEKKPASDTILFYFNTKDSLLVLQRWVEPNEYDRGLSKSVYQTFTVFKKAQ